MWKVVSNLRSEHIYIKDETENTTRTVALIPMGRIYGSEQIDKDAALIAQAPEMKELLEQTLGVMQFGNENAIANQAEQIKELLEGDNND